MKPVLPEPIRLSRERDEKRQKLAGLGQMHHQGFVLSNGVFVDRVAAWGLAERGGQIIGTPPSPGTLFSEDLWDGGSDLPRTDDLKRMTTPRSAR